MHDLGLTDGTEIGTETRTETEVKMTAMLSEKRNASMGWALHSMRLMHPMHSRPDKCCTRCLMHPSMLWGGWG